MRTHRMLFVVLLIAVLQCTLYGQAEEASPSATYRNGALSLRIPSHGARAGAGTLTVELLDPEDNVLASVSTAAKTEGDAWNVLLTPEKPLPFDEIIWQRVHYRFAYNDGGRDAVEGTESVSRILRRPVVRVLGQKTYQAGSDAVIRIMTTDAQSQPLRGRGTVKIELLALNHKPESLFSGALDRRGTTEARVRFPANSGGEAQLHVVAETAIGSTETTQSVRLEQKASILLTTEKPIYQPGQTIHVRALALDHASHKAVGERGVTFEVEDSRGNKVFKKATRTDAFGVASAEFGLADEVNLGTYHLRALMNGAKDNDGDKAELALNVERYVLPKFKVAVEFDKKDGKPKKDYRPGEHVTGTVRANYFFGKAVDSAETTVKATAMDVGMFEAGSAEGKTDKDGVYRFDLKLPNYFAGRPLSAGAARVLLEATVKDSASHSETRGEPITVSQSPLLITAVPEGGELIPGLENQVFVLTAYPDGSPAKTTLTVRSKGVTEQHVSTDDAGVAVVWVAGGAGGATINVDAEGHAGSRASSSIPLHARMGGEQILLRNERAIYRAGERIHLTVYSTRERGTAYVDVVKDGQTILTRDIDIENGRAELSMTATPAMAGTLDINAYMFGRDAQPVGDHRLLFVQPADELKIEAVADAGQYKPGAEARVHFRVTNSHGDGVSAALGLQVVDEAVFALAEKQPGFAKVFFYLEQDVMKPRFEIHSLSMPELVGPVMRPEDNEARKELPARALFSATEMARDENMDVEFGRTLPQEKSWEYTQRYRRAMLPQVTRLAEKMTEMLAHSREAEAPEAFARLAEAGAPETRDAWGAKLRLELVGRTRRGYQYYRLVSAGPDGTFGDGDDIAIAMNVNVNTGRADAPLPPETRRTRIEFRVEHGVGPWVQTAELTGVVIDVSGAIVPTAKVSLRGPGAGLRTVHVNQQAQFSVTVPPGKYTVEIASPGFLTAEGSVSVQARDRVTLTTRLNVGMVTQTVEVNGAAAPMTLMEADERSAVINAKELRDLSVVSRNATDFVKTMPGATGGMNARQRDGNVVGLNEGSGLQNANINGQVVDITMDGGHTFDPGLKKAKGEAPAAHIRSYFPEALYINPEIITDGRGEAEITIPIADSITTWRMAMMASTVNGALGSGTSSLKVFQDFFADLDLPVTLTQGDRVSIPVAIYNYSGAAGEVQLKLQREDWFALVEDEAEKSVRVESGRVGSSQYTVEAKRIGKFKLTLAAEMEGGKQDVVVREIEVIPNGREQSTVFNGRLEKSVQHTIAFPAGAIPDASTVFVRLYPGPLSQIIEGMDSILRMPGGCFEQTSSSTYPNVLALDYMKQTKKLTPEVHARAEGYIANGYQRLLTFEVAGGGFSWFGQAPANKILTSYGLMEFNDMAKVYEVDARLIERTRDWLVSQQQGDGSWKPDTSFINEGATNRFNSDMLRITAYIAWSLANTGYQGPAVAKAKQYIDGHMSGAADAYTLAVIANFAVDYGKDHEFTGRAMRALLNSKTEKGDQVFWSAEETGVYSTGASAAIETTGLAAQALLKWGEANETARKALAFIASKKNATGDWGSTQATIVALRALLLASRMTSADVRGEVQVLLDGKVAQTLQLNAENSDLLHQFAFKEVDANKPTDVEIRFDGSGGLAYQVAGRYFVPWHEKEAAEALAIDVSYDRSRLEQSDIATATATVKNNLDKRANMVMIDLGIPPGFELLSEDLQDLQEKTRTAADGRLEKFSLTGTQAILYLNSLAPHQSLTVKFRLRAKYPIRAKTFQSRVYEYYDPAVSATAVPAQLEVVGKGGR